MNKIKLSAAEALIAGQPLPSDWQCKEGADCLSYDSIDWKQASLREEQVDDHTKPIYETADKVEAEVVVEPAVYDEDTMDLITEAVTEMQMVCPEGYSDDEGVCKMLVGYEQKLSGGMELFNDPDKAHLVQSAQEKAALEQEMSEKLQYLAETDWYVIRKQETDEDYDQSIKDARSAARVRISEIRDLLA